MMRQGRGDMVRQPSRSEWSHIQALFVELIDLDPTAQEHRLAAEDDFIGGQLRELLAASRNSGIFDGAAPSSFESARVEEGRVREGCVSKWRLWGLRQPS